MRKTLAFFLLFALAACAPATSPAQANDREWTLLSADYEWIQTLRAAQKPIPANAPRKQQIEIVLDNRQKLAPTYDVFLAKVEAYYDRTNDPRAATLLANEKILLGDDYMNVLARYEKALEMYRRALEFDPANATAQQRIDLVQKKRYVDMTAFAGVKSGMKEDDVRRMVGFPREDWIKQVVQNNRVYSVWIYPKADGGASAVYFDNGVVYHTNWNAAAPPAK